MPAFRPRHLDNRPPKPVKKPLDINAVEEFPDLGGNKVEKDKPPVKSWANLVKEDDNDELLNPVLETKYVIKEKSIDYFENDIDNIFDIKYGDVCHDISNKIHEFCYFNALPLYNTRSKLPNLVEFIKNTSSALDIIIEDYDKEEEEEEEYDEQEEDTYESDASRE